MHTEVSGNILWLRCSACGVEFPTFLFSGDHDWVTAGLRAKTNLVNKTLCIYERSADVPGGTEVPFAKAEQISSRPGESFQAYRERTKDIKGRYIYVCIACGGAHAERVSTLSIAELESKGYSFVDLVV